MKKYNIQNGTLFMKGKKMYKYPSERLIKFCYKNKIKEIVWANGDFITL